MKLMMKHSVIITFACFAVCCAAIGQTPNPPEVAAEVNGDKITRTSLAAECLQLHGEAELDELINKTLIRLECEQRNITITAEEINAEVLRMAQSSGMTSEQLLQMFEQRRNVTPEQFRQDFIWQILALEQLAGTRLNPSEEEFRMAYEARYGIAIRTRQIVLETRAEAEAAHAELLQHPETFAAVARNKSIDTVTQPFGGMLYPIRRYTMNPEVERILFTLQPGQISPVIEMLPGHFMIYQCVEYLQPVEVDAESAKRELFFDMRTAKRPQVTSEIFGELRNRAQVNVIFGTPSLYSQHPGVAALLNGREISIRELAEICIQKHGTGVLNDMINRLLVEQAARREGIVITEQDIDSDIREMAGKHLPFLPNGAPNVELWLRRATEETGLSIPMYRKNVVVPVLSLKRLTRPHVQVTEEDVQRSFEANFGQKVHCLAIFFRAQDKRRAQEVWQRANRHRTEENFGDLAAEFSFDPDSRLGRGVIPPIARHTGQPLLEREAFSLKPGELSQIIQIDDLLIILFCTGYADPLPVRVEEVRVDLVADIFEKKQQAIIARYFERLLEQAVLTNHLTGEWQNPLLERAMQEDTTLQ